VRHIQAEPSRLSRLQSRSVSRAASREYFREYLSIIENILGNILQRGWRSRTTPEEVEDNKHSLLEEEEAITITVTRGISSVIIANNLSTIALNVKGKLH
jgi:hypothetical protein